MKKIKTAVFIILCLWVVYLILITVIGNLLLKNSGRCIKGVLLKQQSRTSNHKPDLYYEFAYNGKAYKGNSQEEDLSKVGDSVCIVYLKSFPSINRAVKYFDTGEIKCDCTK